MKRKKINTRWKSVKKGGRERRTENEGAKRGKIR